MVRSAARRAIRRLGSGRDVEIRTWKQVGSDAYGEDYAEVSGSPATIPATVDFPTTADPDRSAREQGVDADVVVYLATDDLYTVGGFEYGGATWGGVFGGTFAGTSTGAVIDGGGEGASEVKIDGVWYRVLVSNRYPKGGYQRLLCVRQ
jgi:hypothetical protein